LLAYGTAAEASKRHYHVNWWLRPDPKGSAVPYTSEALCVHRAITMFDECTNKEEDSMGIESVSVHVCIGDRCEEDKCELCGGDDKYNPNRENGIHYHVRWDAKIMRKGRYVWEAMRSSACCSHQATHVFASKSEQRGEHLCDVGIKECTDTTCKTIDACGVCG